MTALQSELHKLQRRILMHGGARNHNSAKTPTRSHTRLHGTLHRCRQYPSTIGRNIAIGRVQQLSTPRCYRQSFSRPHGRILLPRLGSAAKRRRWKLTFTGDTGRARRACTGRAPPTESVWHPYHQQLKLPPPVSDADSHT
jgi:hypothetical protein